MAVFKRLNNQISTGFEFWAFDTTYCGDCSDSQLQWAEHRHTGGQGIEKVLFYWGQGEECGEAVCFVVVVSRQSWVVTRQDLVGWGSIVLTVFSRLWNREGSIKQLLLQKQLAYLSVCAAPLTTLPAFAGGWVIASFLIGCPPWVLLPPCHAATCLLAFHNNRHAEVELSFQNPGGSCARSVFKLHVGGGVGYAVTTYKPKSLKVQLFRNCYSCSIK